MEKLYRIILVFIRHHYLPYIVGVLICLFFLPVFVGIKNLDSFQSAKVLEYCFSIMGLLLIFPMYLPDNDREALQIIRSKKTSYSFIVCVRLFVEVCCSFFLLLALLLMMKNNGSTFPFAYYLSRGMATALFLGGIAAMVFALTKHPVPSMMVAFLYYLFNLLGKKSSLGPLNLFSFAQGSWSDSIFLNGLGLGMLFLSLLITSKVKL